MGVLGASEGMRGAEKAGVGCAGTDGGTATTVGSPAPRPERADRRLSDEGARVRAPAADAGSDAVGITPASLAAPCASAEVDEG